MKTIRYDEDQHEWRYDLDSHTTLVAPTVEELQDSIETVEQFLQGVAHEYLRH